MVKKNKTEIVVVLDNIRSTHNIGSIFRTCDAIGNCKVFLCGICAKPPHKQIYKTALGATESVNWTYFENVKDGLSMLKNENYQIIAVEQTKKSISLNLFHTKAKKIALIFGNEIKGVSKESLSMAEACIQINQYGIKQSMNVSVVTGIVLWSISNK
jgi:tRNA G18 (ribose-2'-O)-methylase SpoU